MVGIGKAADASGGVRRQVRLVIHRIDTRYLHLGFTAGLLLAAAVRRDTNGASS